MTRITLDSDLRRKLGGLERPLELCDESGHVVATVIPATGATPRNDEPRISAEEIARRKREKGQTLSTAEVIAHLESL